MTTKQEALEALLTRCRQFEDPDGTRVVGPDSARHNIEQSFKNWKTAPVSSRGKALEILGAAVLYALIDEADIDKPPVRTVDEWIMGSAVPRVQPDAPASGHPVPTVPGTISRHLRMGHTK